MSKQNTWLKIKVKHLAENVNPPDISKIDNGKCDASEMDNRMVNGSEMGDKWFNAMGSVVRIIKSSNNLNLIH